MSSNSVGEGMLNVVAESGKRFGAEKGAGGSGAEEGGMTDLYKVNQIWYRMLPSLSLVAKRTYLVNQALQGQYTGIDRTIIIVFNTGEYYISPSTSYLYFQCGYKNASYGNAKAIVSQGNIMGLFNEIHFTTASGTEIDRQQDKGVHASTFYRWNHNQEYIDTIGQAQGAATGKYSSLYDGVAPIQVTYGSLGDKTPENTFPSLSGSEGEVLPRTGPAAISQFGYGAVNLNVHSVGVSRAPSTDGKQAPQAAAGTQLPAFCIPLDQVLGVFKPYLNTLFPAGALSGGRLELRLSDMTTALQFMDAGVEGAIAGGTGPQVGSTALNALITAANSGFTISNVYLVLDAFQLQDNVLKRLNQISAGMDGLTYLYDTYDSTKVSQTGTGSIEVQVQQARSRIVRSVCVVRPSVLTTNPYVNSYASEAAITRVCGKVGPGASTQVINRPGAGATAGQTIGGGGITLRALIRAGDGATAQGTQWSAANYQEGLLQLQPPLPDDPYVLNAIWGQETVSSYQAQLGALFFPQQPMTTAVEHYINALFVMCKSIPDKEINGSVTFEDFKGGLGWDLLGSGTPWTQASNGTANGFPLNSYVDPSTNAAYGAWVAPYGCAIYGFLAEKSQLLNLSGLPISNARLLRHRFTFSNTAVGGVRIINCFTQYTRVMKVFLGGRVVVRE